MTLSAYPGLDLACTGCGRVLGTASPLPVRCPELLPGDDVDHLVARPALADTTSWPAGDEANPFLRYRTLLFSYALALQRGLSDEWFVSAVRALDERIGAVDGRRFQATPLVRGAGLEAALGLGAAEDVRGERDRGGALWIKDETRNVSGSHKARHLMGLALVLAVEQASRPAGAVASTGPLAIASCGNAALAAAVVARAAGRSLRVAIPTWADPNVVQRLEALDAQLEVCERSANDPPGDPCFWRFRKRVAEGALPFTCQGSENGLTIDGGLTLGFELADQLRANATLLDRLAIQVGGGALASATIQGLRVARDLGALRRLPAIHAVQTAGVSPLREAWRRFAEGVARRLVSRGVAIPADADDATLARSLHAHAEAAEVAAEAAHAASHRSQYMRPVEHPRPSVATGILDDETYDWRAVVRGMIETGGWPVSVDEATLLATRDDAVRLTGIAADATGTAGLAGVAALHAAGAIARHESVAVLFTGERR